MKFELIFGAGLFILTTIIMKMWLFGDASIVIGMLLLICSIGLILYALVTMLYQKIMKRVNRNGKD